MKTYEDLTLVSIGDYAFPRLLCVFKSYRDNANDEERYFSVKLHRTCVATEKAYSMPKSRESILYKK